MTNADAALIAALAVALAQVWETLGLPRFGAGETPERRAAVAGTHAAVFPPAGG